MNTAQITLYNFLRGLIARTEGQDLVEYSLVFCLIAFGCVSGMGSLATGINTVFSSTATELVVNTT